MSDSNSQLSILQQLLPRAVAGEEAAVDALLRHCSDRMTSLTRRMLGDFQRVRRWAETDEVLQNALMRLVAALGKAKPASARDFLALATLEIRPDLIEQTRPFYGTERIGTNYESRGGN